MKSVPRSYRISFALVFTVFLYWLVLSIPGNFPIAVSRQHNRLGAGGFVGPRITHSPKSAFAEASIKSSDPHTSEKVRKAYGRLPLRFEQNQGQLDESVKFVHRGTRYTLLLKAAAAEMILDRAPTSRSRNEAKRTTLTKEYAVPKETTPTLLRMNLVGADPQASVSGLEELPGKTHYFTGSNPKRWQTNVSAYARVLCEDVYPGIDLIYYGSQNRLEYDFEVAPGSDPKSILWEIDGAKRTEIDAAGNLILHTGHGPVRLDKPRIYQESDGIRRPISGGYVERGVSRIGFEIDSYDSSQPLTIDPVINYATYLGGSGIDLPWSIALDGTGAALVTGQTSSMDFPTSTGAFQTTYGGGDFDVFVTKLNPSGTALEYSTYIGGSARDGGTAIVVDGTGSAYVTGFTFSTDFPSAGSPFQPNKSTERDAFLLKLSSDGSLVQSGFFGGTGGEEAWDMAMDASGAVYIAGRTTSTDLPTTGGAFQPMNRSGSGGILNFFIEGFVACFDTAGQLQAGTYLGGNGHDEVWGVEVDSNDRIAVAGFSSSTNLVTTSFQDSNQGGFDALFYLLDAQLGLVYGTHLGGDEDDWAYDIATDFFGNSFVLGETLSLNFPTTSGAYQAYNAGSLDLFVAQFGIEQTSGGSPAQNGDIGFLYGTFFGSPADEFAYSIVSRSFASGPAPGGQTFITFAGETTDPGAIPTRNVVSEFASSSPGIPGSQRLEAGEIRNTGDVLSSGGGVVFAINDGQGSYDTSAWDAPPGIVVSDFSIDEKNNSVGILSGATWYQYQYTVSPSGVELDPLGETPLSMSEPRHFVIGSEDTGLFADGSSPVVGGYAFTNDVDVWVAPGPAKTIAALNTSITNAVSISAHAGGRPGEVRFVLFDMDLENIIDEFSREIPPNILPHHAFGFGSATNELDVYVQEVEDFTTTNKTYRISRYGAVSNDVTRSTVLQTPETIFDSTFGTASFGPRVAAVIINGVLVQEVDSSGSAFIPTPVPVRLGGMDGDDLIMIYDADFSGAMDIFLSDPLVPGDMRNVGSFPDGVFPTDMVLRDMDGDGDLDIGGRFPGDPGVTIGTLSFSGARPPDLKDAFTISGSIGATLRPSVAVPRDWLNDTDLVPTNSNATFSAWTEDPGLFTASPFQADFADLHDAYVISTDEDFAESGDVFWYPFGENLDPPEQSAEDRVTQGTDQFTGYAVANLGTTTGPVVFTAIDKAGNLIAGPNITNPASRTLQPGEQLPIVDTQLFGSGYADRVAWIRVKSTLDKLTGFFLTFNSSLSFLDGADASQTKLTAFVFPEIEDEGFNDLRVANPEPFPADMTFQLLKSDGKSRTAPANRRVQARGVIVQSFDDLFPGVSPVGSDYLLVAATRGVVPFELLGKSEVFVHGLNGQDYTAGSTTLYCPQYVIGGPDFRTTLSVVNLDSKAGSITLQFFSDSGAQQGATKMMQIAPRGKLFITDQTFFLDAGDSLTQGYLVITADVRMSGSVIFGDPARSRFSAALPLVSNLLSDIVYGQLASNETYFMGVAVLNPGAVDLTATIEVYDASGALQFTVDVPVPAGERRSQLLTQYIPAMVGQDFSSGYVRVRLTSGGASFSLYGTSVLDVLAAVTAQAAP